MEVIQIAWFNYNLFKQSLNCATDIKLSFRLSNYNLIWTKN